MSEIREKLFEDLKQALIEEKRLLGRFYEFCYEHNYFEYDGSGINDEEAYEFLRKANKIRDKLLNNISQNHLYIFEDIQTNSTNNLITAQFVAKEGSFKMVLEVMKEGFHLELV